MACLQEIVEELWSGMMHISGVNLEPKYNKVDYISKCRSWLVDRIYNQAIEFLVLTRKSKMVSKMAATIALLTCKR